MQAIILSGGLGTRLRPLTFTRPKPLMPLYDTTILGHILKGLPKSVDRVCLASNYMIDQIREYIKENEFGPEVIVVEETTPLGTGGAMKNCQRYIDDTFLAFNGDLISSLDLNAFVKFHKKKGGIGSISLWEVPNPTAFGIIEVDRDQRILRFKEKPKPEAAPALTEETLFRDTTEEPEAAEAPEAEAAVSEAAVEVELETTPAAGTGQEAPAPGAGTSEAAPEPEGSAEGIGEKDGATPDDGADVGTSVSFEFDLEADTEEEKSGDSA